MNHFQSIFSTYFLSFTVGDTDLTNVFEDPPLWSKCGGNVTLSISKSMFLLLCNADGQLNIKIAATVRTAISSDNGFVAVDSLDVRSPSFMKSIC